MHIAKNVDFIKQHNYLQVLYSFVWLTKRQWNYGFNF